MVSDASSYDQRALFDRIARGEVAAFKSLFEAYRLRLYAAALKITKSTYAAEEIVQEIFTSLWEGRANLSGVENPSAYILTVAYNKSFRYLKRMASDAQLYQSLRSRIQMGHNEIEEWLDAKETRELVDRVVGQLPSQRQLIYKLSRERGLSHKEIADHLHISLLTVKKQISLALHHIRSMIEGMVPVLLLFFLS